MKKTILILLFNLITFWGLAQFPGPIGFELQLINVNQACGGIFGSSGGSINYNWTNCNGYIATSAGGPNLQVFTQFLNLSQVPSSFTLTGGGSSTIDILSFEPNIWHTISNGSLSYQMKWESSLITDIPAITLPNPTNNICVGEVYTVSIPHPGGDIQGFRWCVSKDAGPWTPIGETVGANLDVIASLSGASVGKRYAVKGMWNGYEVTSLSPASTPVFIYPAAPKLIDGQTQSPTWVETETLEFE